jgi:putative intracellular protease/amidase/uncharacterized protein (DUF952 family)
MRWLYHVTAGGDAPRPGPEGFVHCSFQGDVRETVRLHFARISPRDLRVIRVDPRRVADVRVEGPRAMPHVYGEVPADAVAETTTLEALDAAPDAVTGTRIAVVGFAGMTLLDLVGVLDPLARIATMGIDPQSAVEVVSLTPEPWRAAGASFAAGRVRPPLDGFDVLVVAGGPETRALEQDAEAVAWLSTFPATRLAASVCTGALLLGAAGRLRGKRATTHHTALDSLARFGATVAPGRVVRDGMVVTAGGVTSGLDLGLYLVEWLYGAEARARIAARMEYSPQP